MNNIYYIIFKNNKIMIKEIKFEQYIFVFITYIYVIFSSSYIIKKIYDNEVDKYSFPFNILYFIVTLFFNTKSYGYILNMINNKKYNNTMKYFGFLFILMSISIVMICTVSSYEGTYYYKIVDIITLISTLIYQFIVLFVVHIRISNKMDILLNKINDISNNIQPYSLV